MTHLDLAATRAAVEGERGPDCVVQSMNLTPDPPLATRHRSSHRDMWVEVLPPEHFTQAEAEGQQLDLIVMPTSRSFAKDLVGLSLAFEIADKFSAQLMVICSKDAKVDEFPRQRAKAMGLNAERNLEPCVVDYGETRHVLPDSLAALSPAARFRRPVDTGPKRNLGLVMARNMGARHVLFLDDDIMPMPLDAGPTLSTRSLGYAIHQLQASLTLRAVGFTACEQADNSVVCHIRRLTGADQDIFLGAGALLVKMTDEMPHFPVSTYNEDWLFMMSLCSRSPNYREALGWAGNVHQSAAPIYSSQRAWSEEIGDLVAEALMNLLQDHGSSFLELADSEFWLRAIRARLRMLRNLRSALWGIRMDGDCGMDFQSGIDILRTSTSVYSLVTPDDIRQYLTDLGKDHVEWSGYLSRIPVRG